MKNTKILLTILCLSCFVSLTWAQKFSVELCLTGEYAELRANGKWSFKLKDGSIRNTLKISSNQFGKNISYNLVCPQECDINRRFKIPVFIPNTPAVETRVEALSCHETADGVIQLNLKRGVGPYEFEWSDGANSQNRDGLVAGEYTVTITDNLGCAMEKTFQVNEPDLLESNLVDVAVKDAICNGTKSGSVAIKVRGASALDYSYRWEDGLDTPKRDDLAAGEHTILIKGNDRCRQEKVEVDEPAPLSKNLKIVSNYNGMNVSCADSKDGKIALHVDGGTAPYTINWSASAKKYTAVNDTLLYWDNLAPATYQTTITDANGCESTTTVKLESPDSIQLNSLLSTYGEYQVSCWDEKNGSVQLNTTGGAGSFSYEWMNKDSLISKAGNLENVGAGKYGVIITDANGCTATAKFRLKQARKLSATHDIVRHKKEEVVIKVKARGGAGDYNIGGYKTSSVQKIKIPYGEKANLIIMDENGCTIEKDWSFRAPRKVKPIRVAGRKKRREERFDLVACPTFSGENKSYRLW